MRRHIAVLAAGAIALAWVLPAPVAATAPQPVSFESPWTWGEADDTFNGGTPPICPDGIVYTVGRMQGNPNGSFVQGLWRKLFVCSDDEAWFALQLEGRLSFGPTGAATAFSWVVLDAGGYLAGLHGRGTGYSPDVTDVGGTDYFVGEMHLE